MEQHPPRLKGLTGGSTAVLGTLTPRFQGCLGQVGTGAVGALVRCCRPVVQLLWKSVSQSLKG